MLAASGALSILGAWLLDHQRYRTLSESERVRELARNEEVLVHAGGVLSRTVEESELFPEVVRVASELAGCDQASLTLLSEDCTTSRVVAIHARRPLRIQEMLDVDVPLPLEFLEELRKTTVAEVPGPSRLFNEGTYPVMRRFGVERSLFVVLRTGEKILGYLNLDNARFDPPFTSEQKRAAESLAHQVSIALRNARLVRDLRSANRAKTDFLSMMSHELRTPLHVIMGFTEVIGDALEADPPEIARDALGRIRRASASLLELVESTLDLTRLDAGRDEPVLQSVPLRELLAETARDVEPLAHAKSDRVRLEWLPVDEAVIRTDPRKLRIVLRNLIGNALKFTNDGAVAVACALQARSLTLSVRDTGVGIPPDRLAFVFDMFQQGHSGDDRPYGGVGLGLYLVRRLVEQLGGEVRIESEPGRGTTVTAILPLSEARSSVDLPGSVALGI